MSETKNIDVEIEEWKELFSATKGKPYWKNVKTGKSTWVNPNSTKPTENITDDTKTDPNKDWVELYHTTKEKKYWKNKITGKCTWVDPALASSTTIVSTTAADNSPSLIAIANSATDNDEWEIKTQKSTGRSFWKNKLTGKSTWTDPTQSLDKISKKVITITSAAEQPKTESEWEEKYHAEKGKKYWKNKTTGKAVWHEPPELASKIAAQVTAVSVVQVESEWEEKFHVGKQKKYWKNTVTGQSTWKEPPDVSRSEKTPSQIGPAAVGGAPSLEKPRERLLRAVAWLTADGGFLPDVRCLVELRGNQLQLLATKEAVPSGTHSALAYIAESIHSLQLSDIRSLTCNQTTGELRVTFSSAITESQAATKEAVASAGDGSPSQRVYSLRFSNGGDAQYWLSQLSAGSSSATCAVLDCSQSEIGASSDMRLLTAAHQLALLSLGPGALRFEEEWVLGCSVQPATRDPATCPLAECASDSLLPDSGLVVVRVVLAADDSGSASEESKSCGASFTCITARFAPEVWVSCWAKLGPHNISLHDHGPGSRATLFVRCGSARLEVPDLSRNGGTAPLEVHLVDALVAVPGDSDPRHKSVTVSFMFQNKMELFRWARALALLCGGAAISSKVQQPDRPLDGARQDSLVVALSLLSAVAHRDMVHTGMRRVRLAGSVLRSMRFAQLHHPHQQHMVVLSRGTSEQITEGSVLVSVNGLSSSTVPPVTMQRFLSEFPVQMTADVLLWRFPRSEFQVQLLLVEGAEFDSNTAPPGTDAPMLFPGSAKSQQGLTDRLHTMFATHHSSDTSSSAAVPSSGYGGGGTRSGGGLEQVLLRKRLSILHAPASGSVELTDVAAIRELQITQEAYAAAALATAKDSATKRVSRQDLDCAGRPEDLDWLTCRLMVAGGAISFLHGLRVLVRMHATTCQLRLRTVPGAGETSAELCVELRDGAHQVILRSASDQSSFLDMVTSLLVALNLLGACSSDLIMLRDEAERRTSQLQSMVGTQSPLVPMSTSPSHLLHPAVSFESLCPSRVLHANEDSETSLLQAAEALERTLNALSLPLNFLTAASVQQRVSDLRVSNLANHKLLSQVMTAGFCVANMSSETAGVSNLSAHSVTPPPYSGSSGASGYRNASGALHSEGLISRSNDVPGGDLSTPAGESMDGPTATEETPNDAESDSAVSPISGGGERSPASNRRASMRMSLMSTAVLPAAEPPSADGFGIAMDHTRATIMPFSSQKKIQQQKPQSLGGVLLPADRHNLQQFLKQLRDCPDDLLALASSAAACPPADLGRLAHFVVHRLCHCVSTDSCALSAILARVAAVAASEGTSGPVRETTRLLQVQIQQMFLGADNPTSSVGSGHSAVQSLGRQDSRMTTAMADARQPTSSPSSSIVASALFMLLLKEVASREEVTAFVRHLCAAADVNSVASDSDVADLCAKVVEPFCRRLEAAFSASYAPPTLIAALRVLSQHQSVSDITPPQMLCGCVVSGLCDYIRQFNARNEASRERSMSDEHLEVVTGRVKDLLLACFDLQEVSNEMRGDSRNAGPLKLSLSDYAALSRSKWLLSRCVETACQDPSVFNVPPVLSPVGQLVCLSQRSGRAAALSGLVCVRPSELLFLLQLAEKDGAVATALAVSSRDMAAALERLSASDLQARLTATAYLHHSHNVQHAHTRSPSVGSTLSALDREGTFLLCLDRLSGSLASVAALNPSMTDSLTGGLLDGGGSDDIDLLVPLEGDETDEQGTQATGDLAGLQWLVSVARSALKSVYEQHELNRGRGIVRELVELRENLAARQEVIQACATDQRRLAMCEELSAAFRAELRLQLEWYQLRLRPDPRGVSAGTHRLFLGPHESVGFSDGGSGEWRIKEYDYSAAMSQLVIGRLQLEQRLTRLGFHSATTNPRLSTARHDGETVETPRVGRLNAISKSSRTGGARGSPQRASGQSVPMAVQAGGPNPLWVVMQSVFNNPASPQQTAGLRDGVRK